MRRAGGWSLPAAKGPWTAAGLLSVLLVAAACQGPGGTPGPPRRRWTDPVTGMQFLLIPAGHFMMGTPPGEPHREEQESLHQVSLSRHFYMARHEVTRGEWEHVMGKGAGEFTDCASTCPVESVNYVEIQRFIRVLNEKSGESYRLPTEAEWEYACRAGSSTAYSSGESLSPEEANIDEPGPDGRGRLSPRKPVPVGSYPPNGWGLYDMHGNVWEWTADRHCSYEEGPITDPVGGCDSDLRVIRGGSWHFGADSARCGLRYTHADQDSGPSLGFRLVHDID